MSKFTAFVKQFVTLSVMLPVFCVLGAWDYVRGSGGFGGGMGGALVGLFVTFGAAFVVLVLVASGALSALGLPFLPTLAGLYFGPIALFSLWAAFNEGAK